MIPEEEALPPIHAEKAPIRSVTAWLGGPPLLDAPPDLALALVQDVLAVVRPYDIDSVSTGEPRGYRLSLRGLARLAEAISARRVETLYAMSPPLLPFEEQPRPEGNASASIILGFRDSPNSAARVGLEISPKAGATYAEVAAQLVAFVERWFAPLSAASAFVSVNRFAIGDIVGDAPTQTAYEWRQPAGILTTWPVLRRYVRGVFWGNGLGPDLCARLGGRERVLRDAPALIKHPLGEGAWLQLAEAPPAPREALARLATFLAPLLGWTLEDLRAADRELGVPPAAAPPREEAVRPAVRPPATRATPPARRRKPVPIEWLPGEEDTGVGLNVYLAAPPTPDQQARIEGSSPAGTTMGSREPSAARGFTSPRGRRWTARRCAGTWTSAARTAAERSRISLGGSRPCRA